MRKPRARTQCIFTPASAHDDNKLRKSRLLRLLWDAARFEDLLAGQGWLAAEGLRESPCAECDLSALRPIARDAKTVIRPVEKYLLVGDARSLDVSDRDRVQRRPMPRRPPENSNAGIGHAVKDECCRCDAELCRAVDAAQPLDDVVDIECEIAEPVVGPISRAKLDAPDMAVMPRESIEVRSGPHRWLFGVWKLVVELVRMLSAADDDVHRA